MHRVYFGLEDKGQRAIALQLTSTILDDQLQDVILQHGGKCNDKKQGGKAFGCRK